MKIVREVTYIIHYIKYHGYNNLVPKLFARNMASYAKDVRERLTLWDAKENCLSPLTDKEKDSILILTAYSSNRSIPSEVGMFILL